MCTEPKEISSTFLEYYRNLFTFAGPEGVEDCITDVEERVTEAMNDQLLRTFMAKEVTHALSQMQPLKSPGPDGFSACFYQKYCSIVGREVCHAVLSFLNKFVINVELNCTDIALIPKIKSPSRVMEFQPISLCNMMYKLISKVHANRLKTILPSIISKIGVLLSQGDL